MTKKQIAYQRGTYKRSKKTPLCPKCKSSQTVPVLHGFLSPLLQKSIAAGRAVTADREEWEGRSEWHCNVCGCEWSGRWLRFKKTRSG